MSPAQALDAGCASQLLPSAAAMVAMAEMLTQALLAAVFPGHGVHSGKGPAVKWTEAGGLEVSSW